MKRSIVYIKDLFSRNINEKIEEVIKVDQTNEDDIFNEINEYVATNSITTSFENILESYSNASLSPTEDVGIWISGFFGSGKSSFAKILGLVLEDRRIKSTTSSALFLNRTDSDKITALISKIKTQIPTNSVIFDISKHRSARDQAERITLVMYKVYLDYLGYSNDLEIAQLEMDLEREGNLEMFIETYHSKYGRDWNIEKLKPSLVLNEASIILHQLFPNRFSTDDSWAQTKRRVDITALDFAKLIPELQRLKKKPEHLIFIIDEVGQYISRSKDKMLDLQAIVEAIGMQNKGKIWIVVTAQEKLDEVVDSLEGKKIEFARLRERFSNKVDLEPSDISEVTSKRLLVKRPVAVNELKEIFVENKNIIENYTHLDSSVKKSLVTEESFITLYPFLPYQIDLIIDIISGIRSQPGASRNTGGSNRTIIKLAQQILVHSRTDLGSKEVGCLVTLDHVYDVIEGNLYSEVRKDIGTIEKNHSGTIIPKVAKAICLLQYVRDVPRTKENIAAVLYPKIGDPNPLKDVEMAIDVLLKEQFIRESDGGLKLQTIREKRWETERLSFEPLESDISKLRMEIMSEITENFKLNYLNYKTFKPNIFINEIILNDEKGPFNVGFFFIDEDKWGTEELDKLRNNSREKDTTIFWIVKSNDEIYDHLSNIFRSMQMIAKKERDVKSDEEGKLLHEEKTRKDKYRRIATNSLRTILQKGKIFFRGVEYNIKPDSTDIDSVITVIFNELFPTIFPKFEIGKIKIPKDFKNDILSSTNLSGLPDVYYEQASGHSLIKKEAGKYLVDVQYPILDEVFKFIKSRQSVGAKVLGKDLENFFSGIGYGWHLDVVILSILLLLRANAIELISQGKRFRNYSDPEIGPVFATQKFRATSVSLREDRLTLENLTKSVKAYEEIFGEEIEIDENVLYTALKEKFSKKMQDIKEITRTMDALRLPGAKKIKDLDEILGGITKNVSDDAIIAFSQESVEIKNLINIFNKVQQVLNPTNLPRLQFALKVKEMVAGLKDYFQDVKIQGTIDRFMQDLLSEIFFERMTQIVSDSNEIHIYYKGEYNKLHDERDELITNYLEEVKQLEEWASIAPESQESIISPLSKNLCSHYNFSDFTCENCRSSFEKIMLEIGKSAENFKKAIKKYEQITSRPSVPKSGDPYDIAIDYLKKKKTQGILGKLSDFIDASKVQVEYQIALGRLMDFIPERIVVKDNKIKYEVEDILNNSDCPEVTISSVEDAITIAPDPLPVHKDVVAWGIDIIPLKEKDTIYNVLLKYLRTYLIVKDKDTRNQLFENGIRFNYITLKGEFQDIRGDIKAGKR